jgi:phosphate transport system protein
MFRSLANFFRGDDWTDGIVARFDEMLELAEMNFALCADQLVEGDHVEKIRDELYARDREINSRERAIRRRIIAHLAASPSEHEIPTAFILTTLVKDAERIGDYVKNLFEVMYIDDASSFERQEYDPHYDGIRTRMRQLFAKVRQAFRYSDKTAAHEAIATARETMRHCEVEIHKIAHGTHPTPVAVALVLTGRHYKRILGHLTNIATSVVMPADRIDYYDEPD